MKTKEIIDSHLLDQINFLKSKIEALERQNFGLEQYIKNIDMELEHLKNAHYVVSKTLPPHHHVNWQENKND